MADSKDLRGEDLEVAFWQRLFQATPDHLRQVIEEVSITTTGDKSLEAMSKLELINLISKWIETEKKGQDAGVTSMLVIIQGLTEQEETKPKVIKHSSTTSTRAEEGPPQRTVYQKEFKINGTVEHNKGISFLSVVRQIERGKKKGFTDMEITDAVIKAVPVGSGLRNYLEGRACLDLPSMRKILRAHYKEKTPTELFNQLSQLVQQGKEDAPDFLLRALELRQKVLFTSQEECSTAMNDQHIVDRLFCRTVYTGLRSDIIRTEMKPLLDKNSVNDEELIQEMSTLAMREEEMHKKNKSVDVKVIETTSTESKEKKEAKEGLFMAEIKQLRAEIASLKETVERTPSSSNTTHMSHPRQHNTGGQCKACKNTDRTCTHCWICGSEEHFKAGCKKSRSTRKDTSGSEAGKAKGSRPRD